MNRQFAERLKLLKDFWGNSSGGAYFPPEEEYAHRKEHKKTQETGHHCAQPLMIRMGIEGTVRASFGLYNTKEEIDMLAAGIERVSRMF